MLRTVILASVVFLLCAGAEGCCNEVGKVREAGSITAVEIEPDRDSDRAPMTLFTEDEVYALGEVIEDAATGSPLGIHKTGNDCSVNVLLCIYDNEGDVRNCAPVQDIRNRSDNNSTSLNVPR